MNRVFFVFSVFCAACFQPRTEEVTAAILSCKLAAPMPTCCVADDDCRHDVTAAFVDANVTQEMQDCILDARCDDPTPAEQSTAMDLCLVPRHPRPRRCRPAPRAASPSARTAATLTATASAASTTPTSATPPLTPAATATADSQPGLWTR